MQIGYFLGIVAIVFKIFDYEGRLNKKIKLKKAF